MKKILLVIVALFSIGMFSASAQKMAHLDYNQVMDTLATFKKATKLSQQFETTAQEAAQYLQKQIQSKYAFYEANANTISDIERTILEDEINNLQGRLQEIQETYQKNMEVLNNRYISKIDEWFKKAVEIVGKQQGLDYILYYSEEGGNFWVNRSGGVDVTNAVITQMLILEKADPVVEPGE